MERGQAAGQGDGQNQSWNAWVNGLAVLVSASTDPHNAARCVGFNAHLAVVKRGRFGCENAFRKGKDFIALKLLYDILYISIETL